MPILELPLPPSVNRLWRSNRGRVHVSSRYKSWRKAAGWELVLQKPERLEGWVRVSIAAGRPDRRRRDVDAFPKALLDLLVAHQVIEDDSLVASITSCWSADVAPGRLRVEVEPAQTPKQADLSESAAARRLGIWGRC